jgi:hypothetical protein
MEDCASLRFTRFWSIEGAPRGHDSFDAFPSGRTSVGVTDGTGIDTSILGCTGVGAFFGGGAGSTGNANKDDAGGTAAVFADGARPFP